jgi:peptide/nickel transport system ATP-binding protein
VPIEGSPPDLRSPPAGCRFAARCPFVLPSCTTGTVAVGSNATGHVSACRRDTEADTIRTQALDPATWQRSSSFVMS